MRCGMVWTILDLCFQEEHQQDKCRIKLQRCCYKMVICSMKNKVSVSATNISVFTSEVGWTGFDSGRKRAAKDSFQTHKVFGWISSSQTKSRIQWTNMGISSIRRDSKTTMPTNRIAVMVNIQHCWSSMPPWIGMVPQRNIWRPALSKLGAGRQHICGHFRHFRHAKSGPYSKGSGCFGAEKTKHRQVVHFVAIMYHGPYEVRICYNSPENNLWK